MIRNTCDSRRLNLFLEERLPAEEQRDLEAHISMCPACRGRLDDWAGGAAWWTEVRKHLGGDGAAEMGRPTGSVRSQPVELYFLQRSDRSASLGRLGSYEVLEVLGRGGFGIVLKAFDPALHRPVAIKVLAPEFAVSAAARKRFAREAQAAAAVCHDHVVPVHAVDPDATPPYLVMSFIHGQSLQQRIDRTGPLEVQEILRIGLQTAAGLAAAHAQGLVHRDIKPANIMLENGIERVRITDFGLARAVDDASVSQSGALAGTPQYMSPEQATCETVDQRSDLFALGSTMYAMCTGKAPFRGSPCLAVLKQVCEAEPEAIRSQNPAIPDWLEGIIRKLHAKNPVQRFASADEVAVLLERCLAHVQQPELQKLPIQALELRRPPATSRQGKKGWPAALLVAAVVVTAFALWPRPRTDLIAEANAEANQPDSRQATSDPFNPETETWQAAQDARMQILRLQQSLDATAAESDSVQTDFAEIALRVLSLVRLHHEDSDPEWDPIAAALAALRSQVNQLKQRDAFGQTGPNRLAEGVFP